MHTTQENILTTFLISGLLLTGIVIIFIISIIRQHNRYRKLAKAKINAEILTLENERRRIAADLHDEVGPMLSAIRIQINLLSENAKESELALIEKSSKHIDEVIQKMREISNGLMPNLLVRKGLEAAIRDFEHKVNNGTNLTIKLDLKSECRAPVDVEVNAFRLVQEIIHNTLKHAQASVLSIQLRLTPKMLRLATVDNGIGFDFSQKVGKSGGFGLLNLQSRAEVMGGEMTWESEVGGGTKYLFEIPLTNMQSSNE